MRTWKRIYKYVYVVTSTLLLCLLFSIPSNAEELSNRISSLNSVNKWFILLDYDPDKYSPTINVTSQYDMAILDSDHYPPQELFSPQCIRIGYISLGEAENYRSYWNAISNKTWIISKNPNWEGAYYVDIRSEEWHNLILKEIIPKIVDNGFQGLFLDTLDTVDFLEYNFESQYNGAQQAMINLVKEIRQLYPGLLIISNGGFSILKEISPYLDGILVEDIHMMVDFENDTYRKVSKEDREYKLNIINETLSVNRLPVFNIDYISQTDKKLIKKYFNKSKKLGFKPYIAEKDLNRIYNN